MDRLADDLTWCVTLRDGPKFYDGQAVTTMDVVPSLGHTPGDRSLERVEKH